MKNSISHNFFNKRLDDSSPFLIKKKLVSYNLTINNDLQNFARRLLKRFKTPYSSIVVIDNNNGNVLALAGYNFKSKKDYDQLSLSTTNPGASLYKIISSAALLKTKKVTPESIVYYNGKGTTLYKSQLKNKVNRWTRKINLLRSFAFSNNVSFGKFAQKYLNAKSLHATAESFSFNQGIVNVINSPISTFNLAQSDYQLAEFASGFNKVNTISPLHAAYLSMVVSNGGIKQKLNLISTLKIDDVDIDMKKRKLLSTKKTKILNDQDAKNLEKLMVHTVKRGTARGVGSLLSKSLRKSLIIGAKTGSITGGFPEGKREWVTAFAKPNDKGLGKGISVAVVNILDKKWYVRSSYLAKKMIEYYFNNVKKI